MDTKLSEYIEDSGYDSFCVHPCVCVCVYVCVFFKSHTEDVITSVSDRWRWLSAAMCTYFHSVYLVGFCHLWIRQLRPTISFARVHNEDYLSSCLYRASTVLRHYFIIPN